MANRRMGGMGGGPRGNRSFSQQPFQGGSGLNPWQGSMPQNSVNQGLLSQISSNPQQLALALSSLLQNQQQNPPSLLSLPTPPVFSNQGGDFNRFGNRGRDFRRHEPYNKNRNAGGNNNRNNDNRRRTGNNQNQKKRTSDADKKPAEKKTEKSVDLSTDEAGEEKTSKRDWKDEKNASEEKKNDSSDDTGLEGPYQGVPKEYLNCFVCTKQMWDGESMHKHVKGRAHRQTLETLEESIHITVNILRENMRLLEEKKVIEMDRAHRLNKKYKFQEVESHCNMCDLKFLGKIVAHRKSDGHQRLKRYLHPVCRLCDKEFPSRVEWIEHRLTAEHLRAMAENLKDKSGGADGDVIIKEEENEQDLPLEPLLDEPLQMEVENPALELTDDLSSIQNIMPAYKPDRPVSTQSLVEFSGFKCELCNRSFVDEELAQKHLKTKRHYYAFIDAIKRKFKEQQKAKDAKKPEEQKEKTEGDAEAPADGEAVDQEMYDPEEATNEDESALDAETTQEDEGGDPSVINNSADMLEMVEDEDAEPEEEEMPEPPPPPKKEELKKEPAKPVTSTPKQQAAPAKAAPAAAAAKASPGGVKNGAGPRSKKARKQ